MFMLWPEVTNRVNRGHELGHCLGEQRLQAHDGLLCECICQHLAFGLMLVLVARVWNIPLCSSAGIVPCTLQHVRAMAVNCVGSLGVEDGDVVWSNVNMRSRLLVSILYSKIMLVVHIVPNPP